MKVSEWSSSPYSYFTPWGGKPLILIGWEAWWSGNGGEEKNMSLISCVLKVV
jgi:hypothetical protein